MNAQTQITEDEVTDAEPIVDNARHRELVQQILSGKSQTQSAIDLGYSSRTAAAIAAQILNKPQVRRYFEYHKRKAQEAESAKTGDIATQLVTELKDMALFNAQDVTRVDADGALDIDFTRATREHYKAVTKVKTKTRQIYDNRGNLVATEKHAEVGFADKYRGIELLGKHLGMFKESETRVVVDVADRLLGARQRLLSARRSVGSEGAEEDGDADAQSLSDADYTIISSPGGGGTGV